MKVTLLSRYTRLGASSRLRSLQYVPGLRRAGYNVSVLPFFDDDYVRGPYSGQRSGLKSIRFYARRLAQSVAARNSDLVWIEKEAMPWIPWALEKLILPRKTPYVVDYDYAVFHRYDYDSKGIIRKLLHDKIDRVMENAACVMVGNTYLADRAKSAGARFKD